MMSMTREGELKERGPFTPGQRVGNYSIERFVAAAGQGAVYQALHVSLGRRAAIKALAGRGGLAPSSMARFEREGQSLARFDRHPAIVQVFDFGVVDGVPYLAMEWVDGEDLHERIQRGPVPTNEALQIFAQVARGLAAAHAAGIVHRDIKPRNVLLSRDGRAMVADFGVVRVAESDLTSEGHVPGTQHYMAPEQLSDGSVSPASDMYSVACSLFETLCGRRPFSDWAYSRMSPGRAFPSVREYRRDCPPGLEALLQRLGSQDPSARPTAVATAAELERLLATLATDWLTTELPLPIARARRDARMRARSPVGLSATMSYVDAVCRTSALGLLAHQPPDSLAAALTPLAGDAGPIGWHAVLAGALKVSNRASSISTLEADVRRFATAPLDGPRVRELRAQLGLGGATVTFVSLVTELYAALSPPRAGRDSSALCEAVAHALDEALLAGLPFGSFAAVAWDQDREWDLRGEFPRPGSTGAPAQQSGLFLRGSPPLPLAPFAAFDDGDWYWLAGFDPRGAVLRCATSGHSFVSQDVDLVRRLLPRGGTVVHEADLELPVHQLEEDVTRMPEALRVLLYEAASSAVRDPRRSLQLATQTAEWILSRTLETPSIKLLDACARLRQSTGYPKLVECMADLVLRAPENGLLSARAAELAVFGALWLALWHAGSAGLLVTFGPTEALRALGGAPPATAENASTFKRGSRAMPTGASHVRPSAASGSGEPVLALYCLGPRLPVGRRELRLRRHPAQAGTYVGTLGRDAANDIVIPSQFVSRRHGTIELGPAGLLLAQDQPTNGSAVDGCKLDVGERNAVRPGDLIFLDTEGFLLLDS
jgi:serine/threonine protein kinase